MPFVRNTLHFVLCVSLLTALAAAGTCENEEGAECDGASLAAAPPAQSPTVPPECQDLVAFAADPERLATDRARWDTATSQGRRRNWLPITDEDMHLFTPNGRCDIQRLDAAEVTPARFKKEFLEQKPVIVRGAVDGAPFAAMSQRAVLLYCFGNFDVILSTANQNSYTKLTAPFAEYVTTMVQRQTLNATGIGTWYFFGDNHYGEWSPLFQHYRAPKKYIFSEHTSLSFGIGGSGSGVPFHTHGHVWAEVFHGQKRWFLKAPGPEPPFDGDSTSLKWIVETYPTLPAVERDAILDCTCGPGDAIYIPSMWHHSTLNIGEAVFMSAFV